MEHFDIVVWGGVVLDGTAGPAYRADIGIRGDRIALIGDLSHAAFGRSFDASSLHVAPGFIDIHTHSDMSVPFHPQQESILSQGITSQVVGNCSLCMGFASNEDIFAFEKRWISAHGAKIVWKSFEEHLKFVEDLGVGTNYLMLAGQGTLRKRVMGMSDQKPSESDMSAMKSMLEDALESGAWGISTGLEYTPSRYADVDELVELSKLVADYGGFYASHLRNEGDYLMEAVQEALEIGRRSGIAVQLSHHKSEGRANWGKVHDTLRVVEEARAGGLDVRLDQYPYTAFQTSMAVQFLPEWANRGDHTDVVTRLNDTETRQKIIDDIRSSHPDWDDLGPESLWRQVVIGMARRNPEWQGHSVAELAEEHARNPIELVIEIIRAERNFVSAINFAISEDDIATVMRHPLTMIGSDAVGTSPFGKLGEDRVHPRSYGTFPRVLGRYVRELGVLTEENAIYKMTGAPAARLGLHDRGKIAVGYYADLVIYDPLTVSDRSTFQESHQFARGIETVIVNGRVAWHDGARTDTLAGRVLRRPSTNNHVAD